MFPECLGGEKHLQYEGHRRSSSLQLHEKEKARDGLFFLMIHNEGEKYLKKQTNNKKKNILTVKFVSSLLSQLLYNTFTGSLTDFVYNEAMMPFSKLVSSKTLCYGKNHCDIVHNLVLFTIQIY